MRPTAAVALSLLLVLAGCGAVDVGTAPGASPTTGGDEPGRQATVTRVIDGDTVVVRLASGENETVRLLGVDTPEVRGDTDPTEFEGVPDSEEGRAWLRAWADRASAFAGERLQGAAVRVATDPEADTRDRYGRLLAYVFVDGDLFNLALLEDGYARVYDSRFSRRAAFDAAEAEARAAERGIWGYGSRTLSPTPTTATATADTPRTTAVADGGQTGLVVAEINADAAGDDNQNLDDEYIVFENAGPDTLDLSGWTVTDAAGHRYTFPDGTTLEPGATLTLHTGAGTDSDTDRYWDAGRAVWNNDGDTVVVRDDTGDVVLERRY